MVEFHGVSKVYPRAGGGVTEALVDASFQLGPGEMAVVAGPSGSGKSTLLRLVSGEERASRGTVLVDGADVGSLSPRRLARLRRSLGVVSQDGRLLVGRTVFGNLALVLQALGEARAELRPRAVAALRQAGLVARLGALPSQLAQGERQRLLLARALVTAPRLLLADEPTGTLDDKAVEEVLGLVRAAHGRGTTVLVATRSPQVAACLGGRMLTLERGRLTGGGNVG